MRRLILMFLLLVLLSLACTLQFQTVPEVTQTPVASPAPATEIGVPGNTQDLEGPDINYNGIHFTLDPSFGSRLYVYNDVATIEDKTAHSTHFALTPDDQYCQAWCLIIYPVAEFQQAFGEFVFPPTGYRGGATVVFHAQEKPLSFHNGTGTRALETFAQSIYGVSNESLKYVFRGYSIEKQYAVYVQIPTHTASLPEMSPTLTTGSDPARDMQQYNQQAGETVNALTPADFNPNLDLLDALVTSIQIEKS